VLIGSLELSSRNIVSGAVRLCFACVYALFLGFGLAIGLEVYQKLTGQSVYGANDYMCSESHPGDSPWYRRTPSTWWGERLHFFFALMCNLTHIFPFQRF
jgi:Putative threonine/serine exporter